MEKSGHITGMNTSSVWAICHNRKLLMRCSPLVRIKRSGSGMPLVEPIGKEPFVDRGGIETARRRVAREALRRFDDVAASAVIERDDQREA